MQHTRINTNAQARKLVKYLLTLDSVAVDSETSGFDWLTGNMYFLQFSDGDHCWIVDIRRVDVQIFKPLFENPDVVKIIHNSAFDCSWLAREFDIMTVNIYDTRYNEQIILGIALGRGLTKLEKELYEPSYSASLKWCFYRRDWDSKEEFKMFYPLPWEPSESQVHYMVHDVDMLHALMADQQETIAQMSLENVSTLENEISRITYGMMYNGFGVDVTGWLAYTAQQEQEYSDIMAYLESVAPGLNWQSPKQYCNYFGVVNTAALNDLSNFYDEFGLLNVELTDDKRPVLKNFLRARKIYKNVTTYGRDFITNHVIKGRLRCQYTQMVNTARFSSDKPNMQNLPSNTPHRSFLRSRFKNWQLVRADFSGQEMAIIAFGSQEESWLECLRSGGDLHAMVAADIMEQWSTWSENERKVQRRIVKIINFSIAYGAGVNTIAARAGTTSVEISMRLGKMRHMYPKVFAWLRENARRAKITWESRSFAPFNRYRSLAMETQGWRRENIGMNNPVQMTAADMSKLAMYYYQIEIDKGLKANLIHMEHDELITECPRSGAKANAKILVECMNQACIDILGEPLSQPDVTISENWDKRKAA